MWSPNAPLRPQYLCRSREARHELSTLGRSFEPPQYDVVVKETNDFFDLDYDFDQDDRIS